MIDIHSSEYQKFLKKLIAARKECGMTQAKISEILQSPQPFISKCESVERRVDIIELKSFTEIYNKNINYFIDND